MVEEALVIKGKFQNGLPDSLGIKFEDDKKNWKLLDVNEILLEYFHKFIPSQENIYITISNNIDHLNNLPQNLKNIVNTHKVNDFRHINKFFEVINGKLNMGGLFIGSVETLEERRKRKLQKFSYFISYSYYFLDFILKRVFPKFFLTKKIYFALTKGMNRTLSLAETLGRLIACGFKIVHHEEINNRCYFICKKVKEPTFDQEPSYGFYCKLKRISKDGKTIKVYKLRTMHPYAEYLQDYVYKKNHTQNNGKFNDDFRVTSWGKILRKFWIDELPMLINLFKGELKLVGVRPISHHYFNLYREVLKKKRIKYKPGLIPPFCVDLPKSLNEIMDSEEKYLDSYEKKPLLTDIKYFSKALCNIVSNKVRSS